MSAKTKHWAESLQLGDRCVANIRHETDGNKNVHDARVIVVENEPHKRRILAWYNSKKIYIPYNELSEITFHEIKFRVWDKKSKSFISAPLDICVQSGRLTFTNEMYYSPGKFLYDAIIMQYTGLKDNNGKEIYEGDIIKVGAKVMEVVFSKGCFYSPFCGSNYRVGGWIENSVKVIGNVYQNHDLL